MKKILFVWPQIDDDGGGEFALVNLVHHLRQYFSIDILCYQQIYKQPLPDDVGIFFAAEPNQTRIGKIINKFKLLIKLFMLIKRYDLLIINDVPFINLIVWFVTRLIKSKYIIWAHSCRSEMRPCNNKIISIMYKKSLFAANDIICVSNYAAQSMRDYLNSATVNITVLYNIVNREIPVNDNLNLPNDKIKICAAGRLTHEKNFKLLINALNIVHKQASLSFHLYICGRGIEQQNLYQLIEKNELLDNISLIGHVPNVMSYISQCDIFVSPSNSDSFSLVVYEALLCHKPIITTLTGAAEIIEYGKHGVVVEKNNVEQMSSAIIRLINDNELRRHYEQGTYEALKKYDRAAIIKGWIYEVESVIGNGNK